MSATDETPADDHPRHRPGRQSEPAAEAIRRPRSTPGRPMNDHEATVGPEEG